jgi:hypothetical protein
VPPAPPKALPSASHVLKHCARLFGAKHAQSASQPTQPEQSTVCSQVFFVAASPAFDFKSSREPMEQLVRSSASQSARIPKGRIPDVEGTTSR